MIAKDADAVVYLHIYGVKTVRGSVLATCLTFAT